MERCLIRTACEQTRRLGMIGLVIALGPIVKAESPSDWNVVREPSDSLPTVPRSGYAFDGYATPHSMSPMAPNASGSNSSALPLSITTQRESAANSTDLHDLPLLPPGPRSRSSAKDADLRHSIATPRQIQSKPVSPGVPANLARLQTIETAEAKAMPALSVATAPPQKSVVKSAEYDLSIFESTQATAPPTRRPAQPSTVMPGFGSASLREQAAKHLDESAARLSHQASLSAAAEATEALRQLAQAKDLSTRSSYASTQLDSALTALKEAEDFVDRYGSVDGAAITRMVRAHQTTVLKAYDCSQLTGSSAADVYLDTTRRILADLATTDPLAAHAVACLSKAYRQRTSESRLAMAASVHLMRAAVIAVPNDRELTEELASVLNQAELRTEAQHVLTLAQRLTPRASDPMAGGPIIAVVSGVALDNVNGQPAQAVRLEQITPEMFSQLSRIESGPSGSLPGYAAHPVTSGSNAPASSPNASQPTAQSNGASRGTEPGVIENQVGNPFTRAVKSVTGMWK